MISVFIPVYNEEQILEDSVLRVHYYLSERKVVHEILVVDNGSTDTTSRVGQRLATQYSWFRFFQISERGPGRAFSHAVRESRAEYLICLDCDLSGELVFIDYAKDLLQHADMLVGSKSMGIQNRSAFRVFASQTYILFTQILFGLTISDYSIGSKAFRRSAIIETLDFLDPWTGYIFELCLYFRMKGKKILQVGINCEDTRASHFHLFHEGIYRFSHLYRSWKKTRDKASWFYRV